jgi:hypothetical protein
VIKPLLETIASVISQFSPSLTPAEVSNIRGEMVKAMRIGLDYTNNMPQVKNISAFYSMMLLESNSQVSKSVQDYANDIWEVYLNPSTGYDRVRQDDTTERFARVFGEGSDAFFRFEDTDCELNLFFYGIYIKPFISHSCRSRIQRHKAFIRSQRRPQI